MKGIPVLLFAGEAEDDDDSVFVHWSHYVQRLTSMWALRASASVEDVRLESKMRFGYAKLKTRGRLRDNECAMRQPPKIPILRLPR